MKPCPSGRKGGVFSCLLLFIATLGLGVLLVLAYHLWSRPPWMNDKEAAVSEVQIVKVAVDGAPSDLNRAEAAATKKAKEIWSRRIRKKAMEQFDVAYGWASLDTATKQTLTDALDDAMEHEKLETIKTVDRYADWVGGRVFVLYGMENAEIDAALQRIYEHVNTAMLQAMHLSEAVEIDDTNLSKEQDDENKTIQ